MQVDSHAYSSVADEETVSKPCYARLVVDGMAIDVDVVPAEWRGMDLVETWSVLGKVPFQTAFYKSNAW